MLFLAISTAGTLSDVKMRLVCGLFHRDRGLPCTDRSHNFGSTPRARVTYPEPHLVTGQIVADRPSLSACWLRQVVPHLLWGKALFVTSLSPVQLPGGTDCKPSVPICTLYSSSTLGLDSRDYSNRKTKSWCSIYRLFFSCYEGVLKLSFEGQAFSAQFKNSARFCSIACSDNQELES